MIVAQSMPVAAVPPTIEPGYSNFSFSTPASPLDPANDEYLYDGRIERPDSPRRVGVVLLGGGYGNDLDWTVPADYSATGETLRDGRRLAESLADRGYTVMRWQTIRRDDPLADQWSEGRATVRPYPMLLEEARAAVDAFLLAEGLERVVLVGHSLGGSRAAQIAAADPRVVGVVLLSGAHICRTGADAATRRAEGEALLAAADTDRDGLVLPNEWTAWPGREAALGAGAVFEALDIEADGSLSAWELLAAALDQRRTAFPPEVNFEAGLPGAQWPEDALADRDIPTLMVYGSLDGNHAVHGPLLRARSARLGAPSDLTVVALPGLGHNLSREDGGKLHPIDERALAVVGGWLAEEFPR